MAFLSATKTVLSNNLFTYCENNPINKMDTTGHVVTPANVIGAVIGAIIGIVGGVFLGNWLADRIGLKDWKRKAFVGGIAVLVGAVAGVIGYFIGPYVAKIGVQLAKYVYNLIQKGKIAFSKLSRSSR